MIKIILPLFIMLMAFSVGVEAADKKIVYRYKKYQKFDFEDLVIEGETGGPGDLSISPRYQRKFKNKLPYRKNFNAEIRKGVERVR